MATLLFTHPSCIAHDPAPGHPERPDRLRAVLKALEAPRFDGLVRREAPRAMINQITRVHRPDHVDHILASVPEQGYYNLDADTAMSSESGEAALRAAGAVCGAVDAVMAGEAENAFCAVRPPGHHAEPARAMGFCLFNNIAVGAAHARAEHGLERVAVLDFDVHHGNGTQAIFQGDARVFFASSHQMPLYPGTGRLSETGVGNIVNRPLRPMAGGADFRLAWREHILPALFDFRPEMVFISAGFDGHEDDPLAQLALTEDDFAWVTQEIGKAADQSCDGRIVSSLEGGYDLPSLAASAAAHVAALMSG